MRRSTWLRLGVVASLVALAMLAGEAASGVSAASADRAAHDLVSCPDGASALARVKAGAKAQEPELYRRIRPTPTASSRTGRPCRTGASASRRCST